MNVLASFLSWAWSGPTEWISHFFSQSTQLQYTSSIFQLALGVNAIFAVLINRYLGAKERSLTALKRKVRPHILDTKITDEHVGQYLLSKHGLCVAHKDSFCICFATACLSSAISLRYLLLAALHPTQEISSPLLTFLTFVFFLVNPALYWVFLTISEQLPSQMRSMNMSPYDVSCLQSLVEVARSDRRFMQEMRRLSRQIRRNIWRSRWILLKFKLDDLFEPIFHPVRYMRKRRLERKYRDPKR